VAEGIETAEQAALLTALGYRYGQGYRYAPPLPAAELARHIGRRAIRSTPS
jgi:EAL domain-containing protein (putative c-di-GMP-specific phosphodiesterase class I)